MDNERASLLVCLTNQREHVLGAAEGMADDDLRRPILPSGWHYLGLVQHLTRSVEVFWFQAIVMGQDISQIVTDEMVETEWSVPPEVPAEQVFADYRAAIETANGIIEACDLGAAPAFWPEQQWPTWRLTDNRQILLHVIAETACHAGHLDAARELIDGTQWIVL